MEIRVGRGTPKAGQHVLADFKREEGLKKKGST